MKIGDLVQVHMYANNKEINTKNSGVTFIVYEKNGNLGINWNQERLFYCCDGDTFVPFEQFAPTVIFENVKNGKQYYFSTIENRIVQCRR